MADTTQTTSLIVLAQLYQDSIVKQINRKARTLSELPHETGEAADIRWAAQGDGHLGAAHAEGADVSDFGSDSQTPAVLTYGMYESPFHVSDEALSRAMRNGNPAGNVALWAKNMVDASGKLAKTVNSNFFGGTVSNGIVGFDTAIGSTSNTYAGINRATAGNEFWQPTVNGSSSSALTINQVRTDLSAIVAASGERPDLAICHPYVYAKIEKVFDSSRRFNANVGLLDSSPAVGSNFPTIFIDGCKFIEDVDGYVSGASGYGTIYYVNTNYVKVKTIPYLDLGMFGFMSSEVTATPVDVGAPLAFDFDYTALAKAGHSSRGMVRTQIQLQVERPNACGVRKFVSVNDSDYP